MGILWLTTSKAFRVSSVIRFSCFFLDLSSSWHSDTRNADLMEEVPRVNLDCRRDWVFMKTDLCLALRICSTTLNRMDVTVIPL
ncbi:hypothetical protein DPMN_051114 [Dreissena polymorpha]|uniref:Uncharacterized protein n=1 Tax=Dreissena polymorpha TaxID=45954 RepID=A0A9D4CHB3_DREPO|nr:hypothetical protein DPMN_051114 [Dreissena polymorpha]